MTIKARRAARVAAHCSDAPCQGFGTLDPSNNVKLQGYYGRRKVFATYRPVGGTCPSDCTLLNNGCYAQGGNVNMHQRRAGESRFDPLAWATALPQGALVRWNVSGDVVGPDGRAYRSRIRRAHVARPDLQGWVYTHAWMDSEVAKWARSLPANVRCVASLDDPKDARMAYGMGYRTVASVTPTADGKGFTDSEARAVKGPRGAMTEVGRWGQRVVTSVRPLPCPAQRTNMGCADCMGCMRDGHIVFAIHGPSHKVATSAIATRRLPVVNLDSAPEISDSGRTVGYHVTR